jgi:hypothetical protein
MTRARERLVLTGVGNEKTVSFRTGDRFAALSCHNYLKWILGGLNANPGVREHLELAYIPTDGITLGSPLDSRLFETESPADTLALASRYAAISASRPTPTPLETVLRTIPTKVPASRMNEKLLDSCVFFETNLEPDDGKPAELNDVSTWCDPQSLASIRRSLSLMASAENNEFELLLNQNRRPTAAERGTATHEFLQYCDYATIKREGVEAEITRLCGLGFLHERAAAILDRGMLETFFTGAFFQHLEEASLVERELRFSRFLPMASLTDDAELAEALGDRTLFVQGSIDLLCHFPDGHLELCDYKTDRITEAERRDPDLLRARLTATHRDQLIQYAAAVEEMYGVRPTRAFIFSLPLGEAIRIEL